MKEDRNVITRRDAVKRIAAAGLGALAVPMINRGSYRIFANSNAEYSSRAIELVGRSTVVDMLSILTLDFAKQDRWMTDPESFTAADFQPFKESGINIIHPALRISLHH